MRKKNQKKIAVMLLVFAVCMAAGGCGGSGSYHGRNTEADCAVSGSAVSGGAVSGGAVRERSGKEKNSGYRYATDTDYYYTDEREGKHCLIQKKRDGKQEKEILAMSENVLGYYSIEYVTTDAIYYTVYEEEKPEILYRIPIEKDAQGYDIVRKSGQEKLVEGKSQFDCLCWDFPYVIYAAYKKSGEREIVKYDLQNKKECFRQPFEELGLGGNGGMSVDVFRIRDSYVLLADKGAVCVMEADGTRWNMCEGYKTIGVHESSTAQTENNVYYLPTVINSHIEKQLVWKCDGKDTECLVTAERLEQAAKEAKEAESLDMFGIEEIYTSGDRLYIQCGMNWMDGSMYRMEYLLFSIGEEDRELRYEKELTECMQSRVKTREGIWGESRKKIIKDSVLVNDARCACIMNGRAYLSLYDYEKDEGRMGCYELQTGEFRWVSEKEASGGELRYSGMYDGPLEEMNSIYEKEWDNQYTGTWGFPSDDKEVTGDFYATEK